MGKYSRQGLLQHWVELLAKTTPPIFVCPLDRPSWEMCAINISPGKHSTNLLYMLAAVNPWQVHIFISMDVIARSIKQRPYPTFGKQHTLLWIVILGRPPHWTFKPQNREDLTLEPLSIKSFYLYARLLRENKDSSVSVFRSGCTGWLFPCSLSIF